MSRASNGVARHRRHKRVLQRAKGFWGARSVLFRTAHDAVTRAEKYATIHRRTRKRDFRRLWILRINAACRQLGMNYSQIMNGLKQAKVDLNRKMLADVAVRDSRAFADIAAQARSAHSGS